jgi:hypothetical protein
LEIFRFERRDFLKFFHGADCRFDTGWSFHELNSCPTAIRDCAPFLPEGKLASVNWLKTTGVWLVIAVWLSSSFCAPAQRLQRSSAQDDLAGAYTQSGLLGVQAPAILPVQTVRSPGVRLGGPVLDGPALCSERLELPAVRFPRPDAPGLASSALARNWQFLLRTAAFPRSPSLA